jgi:putative transposase
MELERASHCTYRIRYHMVFVIKYRKDLLREKEISFLKEILLEIGRRYWFKFDAIGMEENHFHVVVGCAPRYAPSRVMQIIKSITAREFFKKYPEVRKILWGAELWTDGGHMDTVSEYGGLEKIKKYVQEQGGNIKQLKLVGF